jgi:hypothetical protein
MAQKHRFRQMGRAAGRPAPPFSSEGRGLRKPPVVVERASPVVYGKPFVVVEDESKNTFIFQAGNWVPHSASIAECRQTCLVKELPQRLNRMIRYEVRCPEGHHS